MIIRDENGKAISAESLSDITAEILEIEELVSEGIKNKKKGGSMPPEEKEALNLRMVDLKALIAYMGTDMQGKAKPHELLPFIKAVAKLKKLAEKADLSEQK